MYRIAPVFQKTFTSFYMPNSFFDILSYNLVTGFNCYMSLNERYLFGYFGIEQTSFDDANAFRFEDFKEKYKDKYPNIYEYLEKKKIIIKISYEKSRFKVDVFDEEKKEHTLFVHSAKRIFEQLEMWSRKEEKEEREEKGKIIMFRRVK